MFQVAVYSSNLKSRKRIAEGVKAAMGERSNVLKIKNYASFNTFCAAWSSSRHPLDLVILELTGDCDTIVSRLRGLRKQDKDIPIFVFYEDEHKELCMELKPRRSWRCTYFWGNEYGELLNGAVQEVMVNKESYYALYIDQVWHRILLKDILYFRKSAESVILKTQQHAFCSNLKLHTVENTLKEKDFLRINRQEVVNFQRICGFQKDGVTLDNGETIPLSRGRKSAFHAKWLKFFHKHHSC